MLCVVNYCVWCVDIVRDARIGVCESNVVCGVECVCVHFGFVDVPVIVY